MVTVRYNNINLAVVFKSDTCARLAKNGFEDIEQIQCAFIGPSGQVYGAGNAWRAAQDAPDDFLGMEIAFGRALKNLHRRERMGVSRVQEERFWEVFHTAVDKQSEADECDERFEALMRQDFEDELDVDFAPEAVGLIVLTEEQQLELNRLRSTLAENTDDHVKYSTDQAECSICGDITKRITELKAGTERALPVAA